MKAQPLLAMLTISIAWLVLGSRQIGLPVVAMSLPRLMSRLGREQAFGSGPLATMIQDVLSLPMYFLIATAMLS